MFNGIEILQDEWHQITLKVVPNENFQEGYADLQTVRGDFFRQLGGTGLVVYLFQSFWTFLSGSLSGNRSICTPWDQIRPYIPLITNRFIGKNMPPYYYAGAWGVLDMYIDRLKTQFEG